MKSNKPTETTWHRCQKCQKVIDDEEWVVYWGSCSDCFDSDYRKYLEGCAETNS